MRWCDSQSIYNQCFLLVANRDPCSVDDTHFLKEYITLDTPDDITVSSPFTVGRYGTNFRNINSYATWIDSY